MLIQTSRFGQVLYEAEDILTFPEGLLGFADLREFVLVDDPSDEIFIWLQSCESTDIAFPLLEPELFIQKYQPGMTKTDNESIRLTPSDKVRFFCIITIPDDPTQMSANMKAPIVINLTLKIARQCVLQDNTLAIREPIFTKLQQRVVQNPQVCIKDQLIGTTQAVKISKSPSPESPL
ncbi:MAG: flagellar assembly protein FliW [Deltaproteobacteria bacterium]|jgi:flagellar assembly factor FliW|nr:flagellar assembly protein FliW [Deltaproteobacteria bacterium]